MDGVLSGVKVAAFTHFAAGPIAAQYLGALGADVIKIESPNKDLNRYAVRDQNDTLDGTSPYFLATNRNQRCVELDLKSENGKAAAAKLISSADVVLENYRPGVLDRLGFGYMDATSLNNRIIYCSFSAYDPDGPARDRPGQDLLMQALSGLASLSGPANVPPVPVGSYLIDGFTAMQGIIGIIGALRQRDRTGKGERIKVAMMEAALYMTAQESSYIMNTGEKPERSASRIAHVQQGAPYGIYAAADGDVALSAFGPSDRFRSAAERLGTDLSAFADITPDVLKSHRDEIAAALQTAISELPKAAVMDRLEGSGIWAAPVNSLTEALDDPAIRAADIVKEFDASWTRPHRVVVEPLKMANSPLRTDMPAPAHGEHTAEILRELGYSESEINEF